MAKIIFEEIGEKSEIDQAGQLIAKPLRFIYDPTKTTQTVYGEVTEDDLVILRGYNYKVDFAKAE